MIKKFNTFINETKVHFFKNNKWFSTSNGNIEQSVKDTKNRFGDDVEFSVDGVEKIFKTIEEYKEWLKSNNKKELNPYTLPKSEENIFINDVIIELKKLLSDKYSKYNMLDDRTEQLINIHRKFIEITKDKLSPEEIAKKLYEYDKKLNESNYILNESLENSKDVKKLLINIIGEIDDEVGLRDLCKMMLKLLDDKDLKKIENHLTSDFEETFYINLINGKNLNLIEYYIKKYGDGFVQEFAYYIILEEKDKNMENIMNLLLKNGLDLNKTKTGNVPYLWMLTYDQKNTMNWIDFLINNGLNINNKDENGKTILLNSYNLYNMVFDYVFFNTDVDFTIKDKNGEDIVDYIIKNKFKNITDKHIEKLIEKNPFYYSRIKNSGYKISDEIKNKYHDLDIGSELGTI